MLNHYTSLKNQIDNKTRGRKHEVRIHDSPELWASMGSGDVIRIMYKHLCVGLLKPDNSLTINIHDWHTQTSVKILQYLVSRNAYLQRNHIWVAGFPLQDNKVELNMLRSVVVPEAIKLFNDEARERLEKVTLSHIPPKCRLMYELGTWKPRYALTQRCVAYAMGDLGVDALTAADIFTCIERPNHIVSNAIERKFA